MRVKAFFLLLFASLFAFVTLLCNSQYSQDRESQIATLTRLTKLPGIALSTDYLEHRNPYYADSSNQLYPRMKNYSQMDYVYAK
ncbi:MAG: hypothetical protein U9N39_05345 [Campylobacterota bacterium]|nr:hypothetical protein [Campylobacterota bacterium]